MQLLMEKEKHENKFGNGFFWGMLFGAGIVILFGTKKGRALLKELSGKASEMLEDFLRDQGLAGEELSGDVESEVNEDEFESQAPESVDKEVLDDKNSNNGHSKKRIFKGVRKRG